MNKAIVIDPGLSKCGLVLADIQQKKVFEALVIQSSHLQRYIKTKFKGENKIQLILGNGTGSDKYAKELITFFPNLIIAEEKDSTFRAKERYFEVFPLKGFKKFFPREIFLLNKNLDALAALIILEDYYKCKFEISELVSIKTWLK
tara:strand:- start:26 stop:463 length:438 start_codon:yes stop_codon:yes gene_type:complete